MANLLVALLLILIAGAILNFRNLFRSVRDSVGQFKSLHYAWIILFIAIVNLGKIDSRDIVVSNSIQILFVVVAVCIISYCFLSRLNYIIISINLPIIALLLYGITGVLSGAYSPFPMFSIYKATLVLISTIACHVFISYSPIYPNARVTLELSIFFYWLLFISSIVGGIIAPEKAFVYKPGMLFSMMSGWIVIANPNGLGMISGVVALVSINRILGGRRLKDKVFYVCAVPATIVVLIFAQSRTCIVAFAFSVILLFLKKRLRYLVLILFIALPIVAFYGINSVKQDAEKYFKRGQTERQLETWSGRLSAWKYSWKKFEEKPLLGYGMAAGVRFGAVSKGLVGSHLHSSYFEVLLNSGLMGFIPWITCLIILTVGMIRRYIFPPVWFTSPMKDLHTEMTAVLVFLILRSIAGTTFVLFDHTFILYLALIVYAITIKKRELVVQEDSSVVSTTRIAKVYVRW